MTEILPLKGLSEDYILSVAAAAEKYSEHPLARAILEAARQKALPLPEPDSFRNIPGAGVEAIVNGHSIFIGASATKENTAIKTITVIRK